MPGPIPKRSDQRRRRNKDVIPIDSAKGVAVKPPTADAKWHPYAKAWFNSLKKSGQAKFLQASDWQEARIVALLISEELGRASGPRAMMMATIFSRADNLLTTEGARRRLRLELSTGEDEPAVDLSVSVMEHYRAALGK